MSTKLALKGLPEAAGLGKGLAVRVETPCPNKRAAGIDSAAPTPSRTKLRRLKLWGKGPQQFKQVDGPSYHEAIEAKSSSRRWDKVRGSYFCATEDFSEIVFGSANCSQKPIISSSLGSPQR